MYKWILYIMIILCAVIWSCDKESPMEYRILEQSSSAIQKLPDGTQWSIAVLDSQRLEYAGLIKEKFGVQSIDNKGTLFEIGSITKLLTSTLLAEMVIVGKLKLDDRVFASSSVTYRDLAQHTSGLERSILDYKVQLGVEEINDFEFDEAFLSSMELILGSVEKGNYAYSNLGYQLLGRVLAEREGKSYETLLKEYIFSKVGMNHTYLKRFNTFEEELAMGQDREGYSITTVDSEYLYAAAGILSTTVDMMKFIQYYLKNGEVMKLMSQEVLYSTDTEGISLGWHIMKTDATSDDIYWWHNGGTLGYRSCIVVDILHQRVVFINTNTSVTHSHENLIDRVASDLILDLN